MNWFHSGMSSFNLDHVQSIRWDWEGEKLKGGRVKMSASAASGPDVFWVGLEDAVKLRYLIMMTADWAMTPDKESV